METICCLCHKIKDEKGWSRQFVLKGKKLSHGYCPDCYRKTMEKVETHFYNQEMPAA
ncbi:MAG: hypothetical protein KKB30_10745 [Proteobacteria bacterium]|nr:hypothetical protein [Pseudomonadota bacterium]MBU1717189.1 hypothetical protein [Pseudomonadota bacterium]